MSSFIRYCAWRKTHPMSGGVMRVSLDRANAYAHLRKQRYGFDLAPLPRSLKLLANNEQQNLLDPASAVATNSVA
jgi:hypothetical protein